MSVTLCSVARNDNKIRAYLLGDQQIAACAAGGRLRLLEVSGKSDNVSHRTALRCHDMRCRPENFRPTNKTINATSRQTPLIAPDLITQEAACDNQTARHPLTRGESA